MVPTTQSGAQVVLSPREIDEWPHTMAARYLTCAWPKGRSASFRVPAVERAVPVCRDMARAWMEYGEIADDDARFAVLLVVSELTTNAVIHTNSFSINGRLRQTRERVIVEVRDEGGVSTASRARRADHSDENGRGLVLVVKCVQSLGTRLETDGSRTVWASVPLTRLGTSD